MTQNILKRLHGAMGDVDYIQREKKSGMNYTITSHDAVTAKVRPVLHQHGIVYYPVKVQATQDGNRTQVHLTVRFCNVDEPTDFIDVESLGYGIDQQDKGPGKAISYAVKYALLKALGLETGDDPEHDSIDHQPGKKPTQPPSGAVLPSADASAAIWQDFAKAKVASALKLTTTAKLDEWQDANKDALDAIKKKSAKLHEWLGQQITAHHNALARKEAA